MQSVKCLLLLLPLLSPSLAIVALPGLELLDLSQLGNVLNMLAQAQTNPLSLKDIGNAVGALLPSLAPWSNALSQLPIADLPLPTIAPGADLSSLLSGLQSLPTLPPLDLAKLFAAPTRCLPKLKSAIESDGALKAEVDGMADRGELAEAIDVALHKAVSGACTATEADKLSAFVEKHADTIRQAEEVLDAFTQDERTRLRQLFSANNLSGIAAFMGQKSVELLTQPELSQKLFKLGIQLSHIQLELMFSPI